MKNTYQNVIAQVSALMEDARPRTIPDVCHALRLAPEAASFALLVLEERREISTGVAGGIRFWRGAGSEIPRLAVQYVAEAHKLRQSDIVGKRREKRIVAARHEAMYIIRRVTNLSYPAIGRIFDTDHSTVMAGCRKTEAAMGLHDDVRDGVKRIEEKLTGFAK